jgi:hypothetical protein
VQDHHSIFSYDPTAYPVTDLSNGIALRAPTLPQWVRYRTYAGRGNVSYITGSHAFKFGSQWMWGHRDRVQVQNGNISLTLRNGSPVSITEYATPWEQIDNLKASIGMFAQDQWTVRRVTLNLGLRFDYLNAYVPPQHLAPTEFVGIRNFAEVDCVPCWKDLSPRLGIAWDVAGDGKTAVKASLGRYVIGMTTDLTNLNNPVNTSVNSATRSWLSDPSGTLDPGKDCVLTNSAANGTCGPVTPSTFGTTGIVTHYDPNVLNGWGKRQYNWDLGTSIQHELLHGVAITGGYFRHWNGNVLANVNQAVSSSDFDPYCVTAPTNPPGLPNGGGYQICGLYDISQTKFGFTNNFVSFAKNYGNWSDVWQGVDVSVNVRLPHGTILQGGTSTGHEVIDNCGVVGQINNVGILYTGLSTPAYGPQNPSGMASPSALYCRIAPPYQTQLKLLGTLPLPYDLQASAVFQSLPGPQITATWAAPNSAIAPSLQRNLAGGAQQATVELIAPGTMYGDRLYQLDTRLTKTFRVLTRTRLTAEADLYNVFNANPVLTLNLRYGSAWQTPTAILPGRMFKGGLRVSF